MRKLEVNVILRTLYAIRDFELLWPGQRAFAQTAIDVAGNEGGSGTVRESSCFEYSPAVCHDPTSESCSRISGVDRAVELPSCLSAPLQRKGIDSSRSDKFHPCISEFQSRNAEF